MPDFILAMGDEESDEMMYEAVEDFSRGVKGEEPGTPDANTTATQGTGNSPGRRRGSYQVCMSKWEGVGGGCCCWWWIVAVASPVRSFVDSPVSCCWYVEGGVVLVQYCVDRVGSCVLHLLFDEEAGNAVGRAHLCLCLPLSASVSLPRNTWYEAFLPRRG